MTCMITKEKYDAVQMLNIHNIAITAHLLPLINLLL